MISNKMKSKRYVGLLYIAPWLLGFLIFQLYPFIASLCYSFTDYTLLNQPQFVGLKNYLTLFNHGQTNSWTNQEDHRAFLRAAFRAAEAGLRTVHRDPAERQNPKGSAFTAACIICRPFWAEAWPCPCSGG